MMRLIGNQIKKIQFFILGRSGIDGKHITNFSSLDCSSYLLFNHEKDTAREFEAVSSICFDYLCIGHNCWSHSFIADLRFSSKTVASSKEL